MTLSTAQLVELSGKLAAAPHARRLQPGVIRTARTVIGQALSNASPESRARFARLLQIAGLSGSREDQFPETPWPAFESAVPGGPPRIAELLPQSARRTLARDAVTRAATMTPRSAASDEQQPTDDDAAIEAAAAKYGPGDPIGRWGPVQARNGRTVGEPCTAGLELCDDHDVDAWLSEAKSWASYAKQLRDKNVTLQWGGQPSLWPQTARRGERAYQRARDILGADLGFFDSGKIVELQEAQRYAKMALELYLRALEAELGTSVEVSEALSKDTITDPSDRPPIIPPPKLPSLPSLGPYLLVATGVVAGVAALSFIPRRSAPQGGTT